MRERGAEKDVREESIEEETDNHRDRERKNKIV